MKKSLICLFGLLSASLFGQGIPYGVEFRVNTSTENNQYYQQITSLLNGSFVICWQSEGQDGSNWGVYGQLFSVIGDRVGDEFRVNTYTEDEQGNPQIASLSDGGFVICWQSKGQDNSDLGVYGQLFSSEGDRIGSEFCINTYTKGEQRNLCIKSLLGGHFVVCWESVQQDGSSMGVYGQLFSSAGVRIGGEFRINTYTEGPQFAPNVTSLPDGGFVFCWGGGCQGDTIDGGVAGQIYSSDGSQIGSEFLINTYTKGIQGYPLITSLTGGGFVVCWYSWDQDGSGTGVYGQLFSSDGSRIGSEIQINTYTEGNQTNAWITSLSGGGFIVCWVNEVPDGYTSEVYGQLFSSDGNKIGDEFSINTEPSEHFSVPRIFSLNGDCFVVCWASDDQDGSDWGLYGQLFLSNGDRIGDEFRINTYTRGNQLYPQITLLQGSGFVVCWESEGQDGSGYGIFGKRFRNFPLNHMLKQYELIEPMNDCSIHTIYPILKWQQPSDQVVCYPWELHYKIFVDDNLDFISPQIIEQDQDTTLTLNNLQPGTTYFWKVLAKNIAGDSLWSSNVNGFFVSPDATDGVERVKKMPEGFALEQNYPNPFNPSTEIKYTIPSTGFVRLMIYDIQGRLIRVLFDGNQTAGSYSLRWDGKDELGQDVSSGIYVYKLSFKNAQGQTTVISRKIGLVR